MKKTFAIIVAMVMMLVSVAAFAETAYPYTEYTYDEANFAEAWRILKEKTAQIYLPSQCANCKKRPYCEVCAAVCYGESMRFDAVPQYMCRKTEAFLKRMKEYYKEISDEG